MAIVPFVSFIQQPIDQNVSLGSTATFTVQATSSDDGVVFYQWITNNPRFVSSVVNVNKPGLNGVSTGFTQGVFDLGVGAQFESYYANISAFQIRGGYAQPGGLIPGATGPSFTTPVTLAVDNGCQLSCYLIQVRTIAQSVGNLPNQQISGAPPSPFMKPIVLFSSANSRAAILKVH